MRIGRGRLIGFLVLMDSDLPFVPDLFSRVTSCNVDDKALLFVHLLFWFLQVSVEPPALSAEQSQIVS